jgi:hypothetical protein
MAIRPYKKYAYTKNTLIQKYTRTRVNEPRRDEGHEGRRKKEEGRRKKEEGRRKRRVGQLVLEVTRLFFVKSLKYL